MEFRESQRDGVSAALQVTAARFYDFTEYRRLQEAAAAIDPRVGLLVLLGGDAGLRRGEIIALEWTDLDLERRTLHVRRSEWKGEVTAPKGGRSRRVPLTAALAAALKAHRHLRGPRVLCHEDGTGLNQNWMWRAMKQATRKAGLPETGHLHILRHTFCSDLAMRGATARAIMELAGHADLQQTSRYMHLSPAAKDAAIKLLDQRPADESVEAGVEAKLQLSQNASEVR